MPGKRAASYSGTRLSPAMRKVADYLVRFGPTEYETLVAEAAGVVPPARAVRRFTRERRSSVGRDPLPVEVQVRSGSRSIVMDSIRQGIRGQRLAIYRTPDGTEMLAITKLGAWAYLGLTLEEKPINPSWTLFNPYPPLQLGVRHAAAREASDDKSPGDDS